ncbi:MAG: heparinase II/III-family protein, partial [Nitrospirae bacterium]|nr:heparinase II/III-family protein [Nitrospirota bacterium]
PDSRVHYFESSGNAVLRDGWHPDAAYVFFDCGVHGAVNYVHAHADALSIEFSSDGVAWIVDPGTYTYTKDPELRDYFRSTAAHNTVVINGLSQAVTAGPFSWSHVPETTFRRLHMTDGETIAEGEHNGYERLVPPVRHSRACHLLKRAEESATTSYVMLRDAIWTVGAAHAQLRFHLPPDCRASNDGRCVRVSHVSGKELTIATWKLEADGTLSPLPIQREMGWVSACYGQRESAVILTAEIDAVGNQTLITVLVPSRPGEDLDLEALSKQESQCIGANR